MKNEDLCKVLQYFNKDNGKNKMFVNKHLTHFCYLISLVLY